MAISEQIQIKSAFSVQLAVAALHGQVGICKISGERMPFQRDIKVIPNWAHYVLTPYVSFQQLRGPL